MILRGSPEIIAAPPEIIAGYDGYEYAPDEWDEEEVAFLGSVVKAVTSPITSVANTALSAGASIGRAGLRTFGTVAKPVVGAASSLASMGIRTATMPLTLSSRIIGGTMGALRGPAQPPPGAGVGMSTHGLTAGGGYPGAPGMMPAKKDNTLLYVAGGVGALALVLLLTRRPARSNPSRRRRRRRSRRR